MRPGFPLGERVGAQVSYTRHIPAVSLVMCHISIWGLAWDTPHGAFCRARAGVLRSQPQCICGVGCGSRGQDAPVFGKCCSDPSYSRLISASHG